MPKKIKPIIKALCVIIPAALLILAFDHKIISAFLSGQVVYGMDLKHFYPWRVFIDQELSQGRIPLWAPYNFGGYPFVGSLQPAIFYPTTLIHLLFPIKAAYNLEVILCMLFMAFFMYLWLKEFSLSGISILSGILIFSLSGFTAYRIYAGHISHLRGVVWLPLIFYSCLRALKARGKLEFSAFLLIAAWAVGFEITSGFPQFVTYTFLNLLIFVFGYLLIIKSKDIKKGIWLFVFLIFAVLLIFSVQIVPTLEGFAYSSIDRSLKYSYSFSLPFKGLVAFLFPNFFGSPLNKNYNSDLTGAPYWEIENYFTILGLMLAFVAIISLRRKRQLNNKNIILLMSLVSLFSLLMALGKNTPVYYITYYLIPGIRGTRAPARILGLLSFSIATLSACGLEFFRGYLENKFKSMRLFVGAALCLAISLIYWDLWAVNGPFIRSAKETLPQSSFNLLAKFESLKREDGSGLWRVDAPILENYGFINGVENMSGANTFQLRLYKEIGDKLLADKVRRLFNVKYIVTRLPEGRSYEGNELESVDYEGYKCTPCESYEEGWYNISFALRIDNNKADVPVAVIAVLGRNDNIVGSKEIKAVDFKSPGAPKSFDLLVQLVSPANLKFSVRFLPGGKGNLTVEHIEAVPLEPDPKDIIMKESDPGLMVLRNKEYLNRINFVPVAYLADKREALEILSDNNFDPRKVVLLHDVNPDTISGVLVSDPYKASDLDNRQAEIKIIKYAPDKLEFTAYIPKKGFILLSQIYYPGWKARIDGIPTPILRADYALSCLQISEGLHQVKVYYQPWYWKFCVFVSAVSCLASLVLISIYFIRRTRWQKS